MDDELKEWVKLYDEMSKCYELLKRDHEKTLKRINELKAMDSSIPYPLHYALKNGAPFHVVRDGKVVNAYAPPNEGWLYPATDAIGLRLEDMLLPGHCENMKNFQKQALSEQRPVSHQFVVRREKSVALRKVTTFPWTSRHATITVTMTD